MGRRPTPVWHKPRRDGRCHTIRSSTSNHTARVPVAGTSARRTTRLFVVAMDGAEPHHVTPLLTTDSPPQRGYVPAGPHVPQLQVAARLGRIGNERSEVCDRGNQPYPVY
jgi:hypothetical protein